MQGKFKIITIFGHNGDSEVWNEGVKEMFKIKINKTKTIIYAREY